MFGRKKNQALFNAIDDSRTVVYDFRLRATRVGFESYRPIEYRLYHQLKEEEMMPRLEEHLNKLFAGVVCDKNGNMLDSLLFGAARVALIDLNKQYYNHQDMIHRLIIRHKADYEDLRRIKEEREAEWEVMKADYGRTCKMLEKEQ